MKQILQQLEQHVTALFHGDSSGHDIYHLRRTMNLAFHIQECEGGDRIVIGVAAYLHDVHRIIGDEDGAYCSPKDSLPKIKEILKGIRLSEQQTEKILHCIEHHEEYNFSTDGKIANDLETQIVQDADNLDAIGAIGVGRTFMYAGAHGLPMWIPDKPFDRAVFDEHKADPSVLHHFHGKLLRLKDNMNTKTAKIMAQRRHEFMETFEKEFFNEWEGKQ